MRLPGRLQAGASRLSVGRSLRDVARWTIPIPGFAAHPGRIHAPSNSLFVGDGWGVAHAAVRFRRFDLTTGAEVASIRTGTAVRCFAVLDGGTELIGATDSRLHRLGLVGLDERARWDHRIPRYSDSIAVRDGVALVANWMATSVSLIDLVGGGVRRRPAPPMMLVVDGAPDVLLVGGSRDGGLAAIDARSAAIRWTRDTPPAIDAAISPDGKILWTTVGVRGSFTRTASGGTTAPPQPSRRLRSERIDGDDTPVEFDLPVAVGPLVAGSSMLWLAAGRDLVEVPLPVGSASARTWKAPEGHSIEWFDPDARLAIAVRRPTPATGSGATSTVAATAFDLS